VPCITRTPSPRHVKLLETGALHSWRVMLTAVVFTSAMASPNRAGLHIGRWTKPPTKCPSSMVTDGPLLGNGDAGAAAGGFGMSPDGKALQQSYYVGKMDFWTQQNRGGAYFSHVAPGHVTLRFGKVLVLVLLLLLMMMMVLLLTDLPSTRPRRRHRRRRRRAAKASAATASYCSTSRAPPTARRSRAAAWPRAE